MLKLCKKYMPETKEAKKARLLEMAQQKKAQLLRWISRRLEFGAGFFLQLLNTSGFLSDIHPTATFGSPIWVGTWIPLYRGTSLGILSVGLRCLTPRISDKPA